MGSTIRRDLILTSQDGKSASRLQRAVLIGYYGQGNLGDELMLICLNQWLKFQGIEVTVIAAQADRVQRQHNLPAVQNHPFLGQYSWIDSLVRGKALRTLGALRRCDVVLCGGGDVIRDQIGWRTFTFQVEKLVVALFLRKPVYLLNVGLSQPATTYGRRILKWLLPRCRGILVRDSRSVEICRDYAATGHLRLVPDIVRRLPDLFRSSTVPVSIARTTVLVALHGDSDVYGKYQMTEARIEIFAGLLDSIVDQHGLNVEFFPFQPEDHGGDVNIARKVRTRMRHSASARILEWTLELPEIAARYLRSRLVIAMRLHAAVLAATYAAPCVLMPYDQKVVEFGKQARIPYSLTPDMLDQPGTAFEMLSRSLSEQVVAAPLEDAQDWMQLTLRSLD